MGRRWYGLRLGDRVVYKAVGQEIEGTIIHLFGSDNNGGIMLDDSGQERKIVCEYCTVIPPDGLFTFRPLDCLTYIVLTHEVDGTIGVHSYTGAEIEDKILRTIKYLGNDISKIAVYVRKPTSNSHALYQEITHDQFKSEILRS